MSASINSKRCFVIMPFSKTTKAHTKEYWDNHFLSFLKPLIESCNVQTFRSVPLRQNILPQIVNDLVTSQIVVADLTDGNPNVFWELGVRQSFRHSTITIADNSFKIPFDISNKSVLRYSESNDSREEFSTLLKEAINDCLANPKRPDSEVLETITGRTSFYATIHHEEIVRKVEGLISESELNMYLLKLIFGQVLKNKGRKLVSIRGKMTIITRLSSGSMELLLADRYLEENSEFYKFVQDLLANIHAINHELAKWDIEKSYEKWFFENIPDLKNVFNAYHQRLAKIQATMLSNW